MFFLAGFFLCLQVVVLSWPTPFHNPFISDSEKSIIIKRLDYLDLDGNSSPRSLPLRRFLLENAPTISFNPQVLHTKFFEILEESSPGIAMVNAFSWQADALELLLWWQFISQLPIRKGEIGMANFSWLYGNTLQSCLRLGSTVGIADSVAIAKEAAEKYNRQDLLSLITNFISNNHQVELAIKEDQKMKDLANDFNNLK